MTPGQTTSLGLEPTLRLRDNPLVIAMARRRLRKKQAIPKLVVVGVMGTCVLLLAAVSRSSTLEAWELARGLLLLAIAILLFVTASSQIAAHVGEDRKTGLLDFHRATPTTPWTDTLGYALGCAAREYASVLVLLPFLALATLFAGGNLLLIPVAIVVILVNGWMYQMLAMLTALVWSKKQLARSSGALVLILLFVGGPLTQEPGLTPAHLTPFPALIELLGKTEYLGELSFFGIPCYQTVFTLLLQATLTVFLFWACARKIRREGAHAFSRAGAIAFFLALTFLVTGALWKQLTTSAFTSQLITGFALGMLAVAAMLAVSLVPSYLEFVRTTRRAQKADRTPRWLEDGSTAWPLIGVFSLAIVSWLAAVAHAASRTNPSIVLDAYTSLAAFGVLAFLAFALGVSEWLRLSLRKASRSSGILIAFLTLVLPWILGTIVAIGAGDSLVPAYVMAVSPLFAAGAPFVILGQHWMANTGNPSLGPVLFSLAVTTCMAAYGHVRASRLRNAIEDARLDDGPCEKN